MGVVINAKRADPQLWDELDRDFKPLDVSERDATLKAFGADLRYRLLQRRVREVRFISNDQNSIKTLTWDMGPATGIDAITIPCGGASDMAQVFDIFETHLAETLPRVYAERAERAKERDHRFTEGIIERAAERTKRALGLSTYGPYGHVQRG
ncbi:MAG: hypothetical protein RLZZ200_2915 [Pseudomonadota bacterium]|jgi:hypothetical protein